EVGRTVAAGDRPDGLREEVQPRWIEAAAEGEVGVEARAIVEAGPVLDRDRQEDLRLRASDEVHERAHQAAVPGPCCDGATPLTHPARSSAKSIMSRSPGERPAWVKIAAASDLCWVPWFTTWASICQ